MTYIKNFMLMIFFVLSLVMAGGYLGQFTAALLTGNTDAVAVLFFPTVIWTLVVIVGTKEAIGR